MLLRAHLVVVTVVVVRHFSDLLKLVGGLSWGLSMFSVETDDRSLSVLLAGEGIRLTIVGKSLF